MPANRRERVPAYAIGEIRVSTGHGGTSAVQGGRMRSLAAATEQQLNEQLAALVAAGEHAIETRRKEVCAAIAAATVQDDHLRRLLPQWPAVAARESWWTQWRVRRQMASTLRQLRFALRR